MPEMNISARDALKGDVVVIGGARCTVTESMEWNEQLWRLNFKDRSMLYLLHTHQLDVEREDPDAEVIEAMAIRIAQSKGRPFYDDAQDWRGAARAALAAYREHTDRENADG